MINIIRPGMLYNPAQQLYLLSVTSRLLERANISKELISGWTELRGILQKTILSFIINFQL
jgi:hypothetical protein